MRQMMFLKHVKSFLRKNPAYEPDLVELSAVVYLLSCKMVGVEPTTKLSSKYRQVKQSRTT